MAVALTEKAADEVRRIKQEMKYADDLALRVEVVGGGCSGFQYKLNFDNTFDDKLDSRFNFHGIDVIVDKKSALYLDGATVDFHEGLEKRGFVFENPNAVKSCGCGSSFSA